MGSRKTISRYHCLWSFKNLFSAISRMHFCHIHHKYFILSYNFDWCRLIILSQKFVMTYGYANTCISTWFTLINSSENHQSFCNELVFCLFQFLSFQCLIYSSYWTSSLTIIWRAFPCPLIKKRSYLELMAVKECQKTCLASKALFLNIFF